MPKNYPRADSHFLFVQQFELVTFILFRYHPINAAQAKKNYDEYISDYYYDYDYEEISSPTKDIVVVEEEKGSTGSTNR